MLAILLGVVIWNCAGNWWNIFVIKIRIQSGLHNGWWPLNIMQLIVTFFRSIIKMWQQNSSWWLLLQLNLQFLVIIQWKWRGKNSDIKYTSYKKKLHKTIPYICCQSKQKISLGQDVDNDAHDLPHPDRIYAHCLGSASSPDSTC